jgi:hypothetical protein
MGKKMQLIFELTKIDHNICPLQRNSNRAFSSSMYGRESADPYVRYLKHPVQCLVE